MKYVQINSVSNGSTGGIMMKKHKELLAAGEESFVFWGRGRGAENEKECNFGTKAGFYLDVLRTRLDGRAGFHSKAATRRLLARLDEIDPDVVHLHNVHGYYVNVEMLFEWLAARRCQVKWTLHDCWAFTGHCAHFTYVGCDQWRRRCGGEGACPQLDTYPKTVSKRSCARNFDDKRRIFNLIPVERMELITPSQWLADLVGESFLSKYPVTVKHNEIDRTVFKPTPSDFRERHGLEGKFVILGVASPWTERKGLSDFVRLAQELDGDRYAVVLVGLSRSQVKRIGRELVALPRTKSAADLAQAYTASDLLVQPSVEETFGMTVVEAQACGTPVVVREGSACAEIADDALASIVGPGFDSLEARIVKLRGGG